MSTVNSVPEEIHLPDIERDALEGILENKLKKIYGSGTYISDFYEAENDNIAVEVGNSFPKDVSDCRPDQEKTIKFIAIDGIQSLSLEYTGSDYIVSLVGREEISDELTEQKKRLREDLGDAMAKATYEKIAETPAVENQLNPIKQILRWTRQYHPVEFEEVRKAQNKEDNKTLEYVKTLENLGFIRLEGELIYAEEPLDKYDLGEISTQEFNTKILGEVVERGYRELSTKLGLNILRHLPKFANGYYFDAIERNDPDLYLDLDAIEENLIELYGYSAKEHRYVLRDKMDELASLDILSRDEEFYHANSETFNQVAQLTSV